MISAILDESKLEYNAPDFNNINDDDFKDAFVSALAEARAEIDEIADNSQEPTFENTVEALEYSGKKLSRAESIFFNLMHADSSDKKQRIAEEIVPMLSEFSIYVSMNDKLFGRVKTIYDKKDTLGLREDSLRLIEKCYKGFVDGGALLSVDEKKEFSELSEKLMLAELTFQNNKLGAVNSFTLHIEDEPGLSGLPEYLVEQAANEAASAGKKGWLFTLHEPSYLPFMKYADDRELRKKMYMAQNSLCMSGEYENESVIKNIVEMRYRKARLLGYSSFADYKLSDRMAAGTSEVNSFLSGLVEKTKPFAIREVNELKNYAESRGFDGGELQGWDFYYWSRKMKAEIFGIDESVLKPYLKLENCINAVFDLASTLYGLSFERIDLPVYHKDVEVWNVKDEEGSHLSLLYLDFFPRKGKSAGAWMTEFRGQYIENGKDVRPFISIVTNFSKPVGDAPSLLTHSEFQTLLHEFGHALHGMLSRVRYPSQSGTNVARDFVELPSQLMEHWAFEPEYLGKFAFHHLTGEPIPDELIEKIRNSKNYLSGYYQMRQLGFGLIDMAWHTIKSPESESAELFENKILKAVRMLPEVKGTAISTSFSHIFSGGYSAGYYSYKWSEVLDCDVFGLFKQKGIFSCEAASSFRKNILEKGSSKNEYEMYVNFMGRKPEINALMKSLGLINN